MSLPNSFMYSNSLLPRPNGEKGLATLSSSRSYATNLSRCTTSCPELELNLWGDCLNLNCWSSSSEGTALNLLCIECIGVAGVKGRACCESVTGLHNCLQRCLAWGKLGGGGDFRNYFVLKKCDSEDLKEVHYFKVN